ncbi:MAG: metallophosphoesterase [Caldilineaceae bacterium]|nr:metallophosphoesterase [Caldilineaceae bacterium]
MRLAVLADIHGNLPALQAVQAELERLQPDFVLLNGDLINPMPFNNYVVDQVRSADMAVVRGNHEFYLLDYGTDKAPKGADDAERWGILHWLVRRIGSDQANYLAALPDELLLRFPGCQPIRVAHGVPGRNRVGFYQSMPVQKAIQEIEDIEERTVISAHTHVQVDRHLYKPDFEDPLTDPHEGKALLKQEFPAEEIVPLAGQPDGAKRHWHLVNPGSIGLPLNGDTHAQFALLDSALESEEPGGWRVQHQRVPYDRRPVLDAFHSEGLLEAGGAIALLFYWELVTAEPEIIQFFRWCRSNGHDPEAEDIKHSFDTYREATGRENFVNERDPLKAALST